MSTKQSIKYISALHFIPRHTAPQNTSKIDMSCTTKNQAKPKSWTILRFYCSNRDFENQSVQFGEKIQMMFSKEYFMKVTFKHCVILAHLVG